MALLWSASRLGGKRWGNSLLNRRSFLKASRKLACRWRIKKNRPIRLANDPSDSRENSSSVIIREIRGQNAGLSTRPRAGLR